MQFSLDLHDPVPFLPYPNLDKINAAVVYLLWNTVLCEDQIHAVMFLASGLHAQETGRAVVGDTWLRGIGHCGVFGVVLSAVLGNMKRARTLVYRQRDQQNPHAPSLSCHTAALSAQLGLAWPHLVALEQARYLLSQSDEQVLDAARNQVEELATADRITAAVQSAPLYGQGPTGSPVDWMDAFSPEQLPDDDTRSDVMFGLLHSR